MSDERETHTGGGASIEGNIETGGGNVAGRDHIEAIQHKIEQLIAIYAAPPDKQGVLMADAAQEIWKTLGEFSKSLGELKSSVDTNTRATERHASSIDQLGKGLILQEQRAERSYDALKAQVETYAANSEKQLKTLGQIAQAMRGQKIIIPDIVMPDGTPAPIPLPVKPLPWWQPYLTPALITILILLILFYMGTGGRIP